MKHACPTRIQGQASTNNMPKMKFPREECRKIDQSNTKEVSRRASLSQHHEKERGGESLEMRKKSVLKASVGKTQHAGGGLRVPEDEGEDLCSKKTFLSSRFSKFHGEVAS
jgi:hypothetical protein